MTKLKITFLFFILFTQLCSYSQSLEFENFTTKNGLLSDDVYKIYQDKQGYIWLFTNYGAMKYNGNKFEQVLKNLPFDESFMYSYFENSKGRKWVANSNAKIYEIIGDSAVQVPGIQKLSDTLKFQIAEIKQLSVDENDNIYVNTKCGAFKIVRSENYKWYELKDKDTSFVSLLDVNNTVFSGINSFFPYLRYHNKYRPLSFKIKYTNGQHVTKTFQFSLKNVHYAYPSNFIRHNGVIYFSYDTRVGIIDESGVVSDLNTNSYILHLCVDKKNRLWVATLNDGLFLYDEYGKLLVLC